MEAPPTLQQQLEASVAVLRSRLDAADARAAAMAAAAAAGCRLCNASVGALVLTIEEPSSDYIAAGKGFGVAYACGGLACVDSKYVLKINGHTLHTSAAAAPVRLSVAQTAKPGK